MSDEFAKQVLGEEAVKSAKDAGREREIANANRSAGTGKKGMGKGKKIAIIASAVVAVAAIALCVIFFWPRKKSETVYLDGLDVLCAPCGITFMKGETFLVTDIYGKKIWSVTGKNATVYAGKNTVEDLYGEPMGGYNDATLQESLFKDPYAIVPFLNGYAVSDTRNHAIRLLRDGAVQTINGRSDGLEEDDIGVTFDQPTGLAVDDKGNLYVADTGRGTIYRIASDGMADILKDGLHAPMGICFANGAIYVAETGEHRIISVSIADGSINLIAGTGEEGDADGPAMTATFASPKGIAVAENGAVYVGDTVNGTVRRVYNGMVETILVADDSKLSTTPVSPTGLYVWEDSLYVCDPFARRIYMISVKEKN